MTLIFLFSLFWGKNICRPQLTCGLERAHGFLNEFVGPMKGAGCDFSLISQFGMEPARQNQNRSNPPLKQTLTVFIKLMCGYELNLRNKYVESELDRHISSLN